MVADGPDQIAEGLLPFAFLFGTLAAFVGLNRRSELIGRFSAMTTLSRSSRPRALRRMTPLITRQPAIVPTREILKTLRTSTVPICSSLISGFSMPSMAERMSSTAS